ncbi:hypothetical protein SNEBB_004149 [Seison nebaliae]|nr:hypothetical protein SNEBB_004149 [Seison nebaliae]
MNSIKKKDNPKFEMNKNRLKSLKDSFNDEFLTFDGLINDMTRNISITMTCILMQIIMNHVALHMRRWMLLKQVFPKLPTAQIVLLNFTIWLMARLTQTVLKIIQPTPSIPHSVFTRIFIRHRSYVKCFKRLTLEIAGKVKMRAMTKTIAI